MGFSLWGLKKALLLTTAWMLLIGGACAWFYGTFAFEPLSSAGRLFLYSLQYSLTTGLLFLVAAALLLKGHASSHKILSLLLFLSVFAFPLAGDGIVLCMNGGLDVSPAVIHTAPVLRKWCTHGRSSTYYHVAVASWRTGISVEELKVSSDEYQRIVPHRTQLKITTHADRLGFEWLETCSVP